MNKRLTLLFGLICCSAALSVSAQSALQQMFDTERAFERAAAEQGLRTSYLRFLADDATIFRPDAVNGKRFWQTRADTMDRLVRKPLFGEISANGMLGYVTGSWALLTPKVANEASAFGEFVTVWEKKPDGEFRIAADIGISHDKPSNEKPLAMLETAVSGDLNKRGWSAADASMRFLQISMTRSGAAAAYEKFADNDIRLLIDGQSPITGKKAVISAMKNYKSLDFPRNIALFQTADLAYVWNPCVFSNSDEGTEKGNCLQVWKLRNKKWLMVLGTFARLPNEVAPTLKTKDD